MRSFLYSQLLQSLARTDAARFLAAHAHDWLVWEPGTWRPPSPNQGTLIIQASQLAPAKGGEALAFALVPRPDRDGQIALGRAEACEICINDATLSQTHLVLAQVPGGWTVRDAGSSNGSWLDGQKLVPGTPVRMKPGSIVRAAQVSFTFLPPAQMLERLQLSASRARPPGA